MSATPTTEVTLICRNDQCPTLDPELAAADAVLDRDRFTWQAPAHHTFDRRVEIDDRHGAHRCPECGTPGQPIP